MPVISLSNNTEPQGPTHLNMIEMAAPSISYIYAKYFLYTQNFFIDNIFDTARDFIIRL